MFERWGVKNIALLRLWGVRYMWVESARRGEDGRAVAPRRTMGALTKVFSVIVVEGHYGIRLFSVASISVCVPASAFVCQLRCRGYYALRRHHRCLWCRRSLGGQLYCK